MNGPVIAKDAHGAIRSLVFEGGPVTIRFESSTDRQIVIEAAGIEERWAIYPCDYAGDAYLEIQ